MVYAVCCKSCGHIERHAWGPPDTPEAGKRTTVPLTPRGQVPIYCPACGQRTWRVPATAEDLEQFEAKQAKAARAAALCGTPATIEGILKIPEELRAAPEIKTALGNLLAPLEGETLKTAQTLVLRVYRSGVSADAGWWVDAYDKAVAQALKPAKAAKVSA